MKFLDFLNESVTPYHTVESLKKMFLQEGFVERKLAEKFPDSENCKFFMIRGGALIAVKMPSKKTNHAKFRIALAHTDFPALKISPNPDKASGGVKKLHTEVYGSPLFTSWLDRDLGYAGVLVYEKNGCIQTKLVRGDKLLRIPELAIHMNRGVNQNGMQVDPQVDFDALLSCEKLCTEKFASLLGRKLSEGERLLDFDIQLFDAQPSTLGGFNDEWIYSGRLDNLCSCHAVAEGLVNADSCEDICVACFFNNEEIGSETCEGACGNFLRSVLDCTMDASMISGALSESFALSIDMAHAVHPNHVEKHEPNHAPILGGGIVLKMNAQKRYASDAISSAKLRLLCEHAGVPLQTFIMRNDMPCGSTVGPAVSSSLGIPTADIGEPMLSMHSIREMIAAKDHDDMIRVVKALFGKM